MIDKIIRITENELVVIYDNRPPLTVASDNGSALHLVEHLLSPRYDMPYSEYLALSELAEEDTDILEVA